MSKPSLLAKRIFFWAGIYGILVLFPLYFLEDSLGQAFPPPANRPEQYYGFIGVALAWQFGFLLIARDVRRFRPFMLPAAAEKFLSGGAVAILYAGDRVTTATLVPSVIDLCLGVLFAVAFFIAGKPAHAGAASGA